MRDWLVFVIAVVLLSWAGLFMYRDLRTHPQKQYYLVTDMKQLNYHKEFGPISTLATCEEGRAYALEMAAKPPALEGYTAYCEGR